LLQEKIGAATNITKPKYKISSLSYRVSQYKNFVTAYLLENFSHNDMILTYHGVLCKPQDLHSHPTGHSHLDELNIAQLRKTLINFDDNFSGSSPVGNGNWLNSAYTDALINLTNESFHYSHTIIQGHQYQWPGPYLTEKTFKPLLAGRPFLPVGQCDTYQFLESVGFKTNFGFDKEFDRDAGDLTRIGKIFDTIDLINNRSVVDLFDESFDAVKHNTQWILSDNFYQCCNSMNHQHDLSFF
jgi:hypothetical protein